MTARAWAWQAPRFSAPVAPRCLISAPEPLPGENPKPSPETGDSGGRSVWVGALSWRGLTPGLAVSGRGPREVQVHRFLDQMSLISRLPSDWI